MVNITLEESVNNEWNVMLQSKADYSIEWVIQYYSLNDQGQI